MAGDRKASTGADARTASTLTPSARSRIPILRPLGRVLDPAKVAIILGVGVASAALTLVIGGVFGSGNWESAVGEAISSLVTLTATAVVVVLLIDWLRQSRWQRAEMEDLRSILLLSSLIASGSENAAYFRPAAFDLPQAKKRLGDEIEGLDGLGDKLGGAVRDTGEGSALNVVFAMPGAATDLGGYYRGGARPRRLSYLATLVDTHLPGLVERHDDPGLFAEFVALRYAVMAATAAARDVEEQVRVRILMDRPGVLRPFLEEHPDSAAIDPVDLLVRASRSIVGEYEDPDTMRRELESQAGGKETLRQVNFVRICIDAVATEIGAVRKALVCLKDILEREDLEADILLAEEEAKEQVVRLLSQGTDSV